MKLIGGSGHALVVAEVAAALGIKVEGMLTPDECDREVNGVRVPSHIETPLFVAIGDNRRRRLIVEAMGEGVDYPRLVSPQAMVSPTAVIGEGTVVMAGAVIQAGARIGRHCIVNSGAVVDHECVVGDYAHISPNATLCGNVQVGREAWIGAGATIIPGLSIGRGTVIGAGSTVVDSQPDGAKAYGIKATAR